MAEFPPPTAAAGEMADWDAVETARAVRQGEVTPHEVVEQAIARAQQVQSTVGGLATESYEQARASAASSRRPGDPRARGPLRGVPTAVKDLYDLQGVRTTFGSRASGTHIATRTAPAVAQLLGTGMVSLGKSAAPEYGMTPTTEPLGFPPTRNPWDTAHSTGGSSGGAAALVAARVVPIAHATDGGGSIRIPASCCGLVGLKPSDGRLVDLDGNILLPVRILASGVVSRTVRDTAAFFAATEGGGPRRSTMLPPIGAVTRPGTDRLRIAVVTASPVATIDPEVLAVTRYTAHVLERLGHAVEEVSPPFAPGMGEDFVRYWGLLAAGLGPVGRHDVGRSFDAARFDPWTRGLAAHARASAWQLPGAIARLRAFRGEYAAFMSRFHLVVNPTIAILPPPLGWLDVELPFEEHRRRAVAFTPFTPAWNVSGAPAVSLPMGLSSTGLPIGVQLGAAMGAERLLLQTALALEEAVPFNRPLREIRTTEAFAAAG
ncbi:amidase [soil metagenome]